LAHSEDVPRSASCRLPTSSRMYSGVSRPNRLIPTSQDNNGRHASSMKDRHIKMLNLVRNCVGATGVVPENGSPLSMKLSRISARCRGNSWAHGGLATLLPIKRVVVSHRQTTHTSRCLSKTA